MECKVIRVMSSVFTFFLIGIYPEWNVKLVIKLHSLKTIFIRVKPNWKVKTGGISIGDTPTPLK